MTTPTASELCVVDSSGWVEYFGDGPKAQQLDPFFSMESFLLTPALVLFEVYRKLTQTRGSALADGFLSAALRTQVISLDENIALAAARVSLQHNLATADSIIYASARYYEAHLVTLDKDFSGLPHVTVL